MVGMARPTPRSRLETSDEHRSAAASGGFAGEQHRYLPSMGRSGLRGFVVAQDVRREAVTRAFGGGRGGSGAGFGDDGAVQAAGRDGGGAGDTGAEQEAATGEAGRLFASRAGSAWR